MRISFEPAKRERILSARGLDFADAASIFAGQTFEFEDTRRGDGERRIVCYGLLDGRMVVVAYCPREHVRHVFSMRKADDREKRAIRRTWKSRIAQVDPHVIRSEEYGETPELTDEMFARAVSKKGGRPRLADANGGQIESRASAGCETILADIRMCASPAHFARSRLPWPNCWSPSLPAN